MYTLYVKYFRLSHNFTYLFFWFSFQFTCMLAFLPVFNRRSTYDFPILFLYKYESMFLKM